MCVNRWSVQEKNDTGSKSLEIMNLPGGKFIDAEEMLEAPSISFPKAEFFTESW